MKQYFIYISIILLALLSACSPDDVEQGTGEGEMTTVTMSIGTRATGTAEAPAYDIEKIHSWWVVFVDKNNNVKKIVSRPSASTTYVEEEKIEVDIPTGTYTLYSFANISQEDLATKTGITFTEGSACPDVDDATIALESDWPTTTDIPMSGKQSVTVTGRANEVFSVEVVRMLAKIELQYSNESSKNVTINSMTMMQSPSTSIPLLPNYTYLDSGWPVDDYTGSEDLIGSTTADYSEKNNGGTNNYPITKIADDHWTVELKKFGSGDPNWYSRTTWKTGKTVKAEEAVQISMTLKSTYDITKLEIGVRDNSESDIRSGSKYSITTLTAGVETNASFIVSGEDMTNFHLQINAAYSAEDHNLLDISNLKVERIKSMDYTRTYSDKTLTAYSGSGTAASWTDRFYMRESQANYNVSQRYLFKLNITREGGNPHDLLFALTRNMSSIYRNDYIIIPLIISDFMVDMDVNFYPPIGGYPAVITTNNKEEFYCQFATQGLFNVRPNVINASNGYSVVYNDSSQDPYYTYAITGISDPDGIFSTTPAIEAVGGEIVGEMNTNQGTAYIDVQITVHRGSGLDEIDQIYDRRVYIIRKNA